MSNLTWLNPTPHATSCVRFVFGIAAASRNTRFQAARYDLTWAGLPPADRASFGWRLLIGKPLFSRSRRVAFRGIMSWADCTRALKGHQEPPALIGIASPGLGCTNCNA